MKVTIIGGTGKEARGMALRWAKAGHSVMLGSRDKARAEDKATELSALGCGVLTGNDNREACQGADVVVLSIPYSAHAQTLQELADTLASALVIDITVPLKPPAVRTVHLPEGTAAALETQALLGPNAKVVAAMHHVSAVHLADIEHAIDCDVLACSDHPEALQTALALIQDLGVRAFDAGPLANAVALESLTPVMLHMNKRYKSAGVGIRLTGV
jgi:NADPH-dependent F420 reductase